MKNTKKYFKPEMEIVEFQAEDVICTSSVPPAPPVSGPQMEQSQVPFFDALSDVLNINN